MSEEETQEELEKQDQEEIQKEDTNDGDFDEKKEEEPEEELTNQELETQRLQNRVSNLQDNTVRLATDMGREAVVCSKYEKFREKVIPIMLKVLDVVDPFIPSPFNLIPKLVKSTLEVMQNSNGIKEIFENSVGAVMNFVKNITKTFSKNQKTTEIVEQGADFVTGFVKKVSEPIANNIDKLISKKRSNSLPPQQLSGAGNELDNLISNQQQASLDGATQDLNSLDGLSQSQKQER